MFAPQILSLNMSKFNKLRVLEVKQETADAVSVSFEVPAELKQAYNYIPGQYTTLKLNVNGENVNRSYSFCSSPHLNEPLTIAVKKVEGGKGSNFIASNFKPGEEVEVMEPMGNFYTTITPANQRHNILFAVGSDITPLLSIFNSVLTHNPKRKFT